MSYLSLRHAQRLHAAFAPLVVLESPPADELYPQLTAAVSGLLGAEMVCFDTFSAEGHMHTLSTNDTSVFTPALLRHLTRLIPEHPLFQGVFLEREAQPLKISDFCSPGQYYRTAIFNECYRPVGIRHQLIVGFDVPGMGFTTCALSRTGHDFTETDRTLLAFVRSHLISLLRPGLTTSAARTWGLTPREVEIVQLLIKGMSDKQIASYCQLSLRTVHVHVRNIAEKMGAPTRTAIVARVLTRN